jgi:hypothetical protein
VARVDVAGRFKVVSCQLSVLSFGEEKPKRKTTQTRGERRRGPGAEEPAFTKMGHLQEEGWLLVVGSP